MDLCVLVASVLDAAKECLHCVCFWRTAAFNERCKMPIGNALVLSPLADSIGKKTRTSENKCYNWICTAKWRHGCKPKPEILTKSWRESLTKHPRSSNAVFGQFPGSLCGLCICSRIFSSVPEVNIGEIDVSQPSLAFSSCPTTSTSPTSLTSNEEAEPGG